MVRLALNIMPSSEELGQGLLSLSLSRRRCHEMGRRQGQPRTPATTAGLPKLDSRLYSATGLEEGHFGRTAPPGCLTGVVEKMPDNTRYTGPIHTSVSYLICINAPERGVPTRKSRKAVHAQVDGIHSLISLAFSPRDKESKSNGATSLRAARVRPRALSCLVSREKKSHLSLVAYRK